MRKTAQASAQNFKADLPQIRADMHCDALTAKRALGGHVKKTELSAGTFQCFAIFTKENDAAAYSAAKTLFYNVFSGDKFAIVKNYEDLSAAFKTGAIPCALTCENIGFTYGEYEKVLSLRRDGVIMASLVWNYENALAYPNVRADGVRERRGLKARGRDTLRALDESGIIVDISHLSDGGAEEILKNRRIPVVASHSCADAVHKNPRNLTDFQLKLLAESGGVIGVNFYKKFLGGEGGFSEISAHIKHIIAVAGEDAPAFGSDWDGVPSGGISVYPRNMPQLMEFLHDDGLNYATIEKIAYKNFLRVFREVCK